MLGSRFSMNADLRQVQKMKMRATFYSSPEQYCSPALCDAQKESLQSPKANDLFSIGMVLAEVYYLDRSLSRSSILNRIKVQRQSKLQNQDIYLRILTRLLSPSLDERNRLNVFEFVSLLEENHCSQHSTLAPELSGGLEKLLKELTF